jgi:hypothetical protein
MYQNMGRVDRTMRAVVGAGGLVAAFWLSTSTVMRGVIVGISVLLLLTSAAGICPAYMPLKLSTRKR